MAVVEISEETLKKLSSNGELLLVDFYSTSCGPCRALLPVLDSLSELVQIAKVNVYENINVAVEYNVSALPTLLFIKDGKVLDKLVGLQSKELLESKIKEYKIKE